MQSSSPKALWNFYWPLVRSQGTGFLTRSADRLGKAVNVIAIVLAVATGLNQQLGSLLSLKWLHFSPWFAVVPLALDLVYGLLDLGYRQNQKAEAETRGAQADRDALFKDVSSLVGFRADQHVAVRSAVVEATKNMKLSAMDRQVLIEWAYQAMRGMKLVYQKSGQGTSQITLVCKGINYNLWDTSEKFIDDLIDVHEQVVRELQARANPTELRQ